MCLVGLALFLADALARLAPQLRGSRSHVAMVALAAVVTSMAVFQIDGYAGPSAKTLAAGQAAPGFDAHEQWSAQDTILDPLADSFLDSRRLDARAARADGELPGGVHLHRHRGSRPPHGLDRPLVRVAARRYRHAPAPAGVAHVRAVRHDRSDTRGRHHERSCSRRTCSRSDSSSRSRWSVPLTQDNPQWVVGSNVLPRSSHGSPEARVRRSVRRTATVTAPIEFLGVQLRPVHGPMSNGSVVKVGGWLGVLEQEHAAAVVRARGRERSLREVGS